MGFNTVVLILNDHFSSIRQSPRTLTWALTHPPHSERELVEEWWRMLRQVADEYEEPHISQSALKIIPTFHMEARQILAAGRNMIESLQGSFDSNSEQNYAKVKIPDWWKNG